MGVFDRAKELGQCEAVLSVKGAHYKCDVNAPHPGLAHGSREAEAIWCSDDEARQAAAAAQSVKG